MNLFPIKPTDKSCLLDTHAKMYFELREQYIDFEKERLK